MFRVALPILAAALLTGCTNEDLDPGPAHHHTKTVELDKAEIVRVTLKMGAGELSVSGGSPDSWMPISSITAWFPNPQSATTPPECAVT